jgi:transposase
MVKRRTQYTREFKLDALRLMKDSGKPVAEIAKDLGISRSVLSIWRRDLESMGQDAFPGKGNLGSGDRAEIIDLRRRLAIAEEERDILKKALGYFAKDRR